MGVAPLRTTEAPIPVLRTNFNEFFDRFSPDGRWMANAWDESGREEVDVQPFAPGPSGAGGNWQISTDGDREPRWRRDGKEMFYLAADHQLMAVGVEISGATFEAATPRRCSGRGWPVLALPTM